MHELPIVINITLALVVAFIGGWLARRIGLPTIVGYLLAGIVIGPFTPGFVGDTRHHPAAGRAGGDFFDVWRRAAFFISGSLAGAGYRHPRGADPNRSSPRCSGLA